MYSKQSHSFMTTNNPISPVYPIAADPASMISTPGTAIPDDLNIPRPREEVLQEIYQDSASRVHFEKLSASEQEALLEFCIGNRNLKITYDPFFHHIFDPVTKPNRLNSFLSAILMQPVKVIAVLPREGIRLSAESSLMIMDILVELSDGTLICVEMQKIGYDFPIERIFCYGADLLVRQYGRIRDTLGDSFTYKDMKPVYIIVLMEKSPAVFRSHTDIFLHHSDFRLDSGIRVKNLMHFLYIPLDIFLKMPHNELTELEAWLYFLSSDNPLHIQKIMEKYPFFRELYQDIVDFRYHPKELISMFSEALIIADRNTVHLMIDELKQETAEKDLLLAAKDTIISEKDAALSEKDAALSEKDTIISEKDAALSEKDTIIAQMAAKIKELETNIVF